MDNSGKLEKYIIRIPVEIKQKINNLTNDNGMTDNDFIKFVIYNIEEFIRINEVSITTVKELRNLKDEFKILESIYEEKTQVINEQKKQLTQLLASTKQEYVSTIKSLTEQNEKLNEKLGIQEKLLDETLAQNNELSARINKLEEIAAQYRIIIKDLENKVEELTTIDKTYRQAQEEILELKAALNEIRKNYDDLTQQKEHEINEIKLVHSRELPDMENSLTEKLKELDHSFKEKVGDLTEQLSKVRNELESVLEEKNALQFKLDLFRKVKLSRKVRQNEIGKKRKYNRR